MKERAGITPPFLTSELPGSELLASSPGHRDYILLNEIKI
jgi:hypothetical protein